MDQYEDKMWDEDDEQDELLDFIDALIEQVVVPSMQHPRMLNPVRLQALKKAEQGLKPMLEEMDVNAELKVHMSPEFLMGSIRVEMDELDVEDPVRFAALTSEADHMELYPLVNGRVRLELTYRSMYFIVNGKTGPT